MEISQERTRENVTCPLGKGVTLANVVTNVAILQSPRVWESHGTLRGPSSLTRLDFSQVPL